MSRKSTKHKREFQPDSVYQSVGVTRFINRVMLSGKKSIAEKIVYESLESLAKESSSPALESFQKALQNVAPLMEVKSRRVGGSTYQVPIEVKYERGLALAMKWVISAARKRSGLSMVDRLSKELLDAYNETGAAITTKINTHKMAEANKAFSHYRF